MWILSLNIDNLGLKVHEYMIVSTNDMQNQWFRAYKFYEMRTTCSANNLRSSVQLLDGKYVLYARFG